MESPLTRFTGMNFESNPAFHLFENFTGGKFRYLFENRSAYEK